jgi:uncharacterized membrane protein YbhN (UPF0104 family)
MTRHEPDRTSARRGFHRKAALGLLVSIGLLALILSRLELDSLARALVGANRFGMLVSVALFGLALVCTGLRWRIGVNLAGLPLSLAVIARAALGGHLLNLVLLGPAGGDVAKSAAWSRWYGVPLHQLLAACIMDRSLAALAAVLFLALTLVLILFGDFDLPLALGDGDLASGEWGLVLVATILILTGLVYRLRHAPFLQNLGRSLRSTLRAAIGKPGQVMGGALLGLGSQVLMSLSVGTALWSVTTVPVDWLAIAWTFPLITAAAALPTSFAGAGVREAVSILLLARYGIPAEDLVAAGFIYLGVHVTWAIAGGACLVWEEHHYSAHEQTDQP